LVNQPTQRLRVGRLHVLTDVRWHPGTTHAQLALEALRAGAQVVQIRAKSATPAMLTLWANEIVHVAKQENLPGLCLLNDDAETAAQCSAHGAHVGQTDTPPTQARRWLGPNRILGATVHNQQELDALAGLNIDYIGVGPVFGTQSKDVGLPPLGLDGLAALCAASPFPVIAIGNIQTPEQVRQAIAAGAYGVAVLSAVWAAPHPAEAIRILLSALPQD